MKTVMPTLAIVALIGVSVAAAHEGHKHAKGAPAVAAKPQAKIAIGVEKVSLIGEIIDPQCWFTHNGQGTDHAECAVSCARGGQDLAFLDAKSGEVYTVLAAAHGKNPNVGLYDHVGMQVSVRGTAYRRGGNRGLLIEAVERAR